MVLGVCPLHHGEIGSGMLRYPESTEEVFLGKVDGKVLFPAGHVCSVIW